MNYFYNKIKNLIFMYFTKLAMRVFLLLKKEIILVKIFKNYTEKTHKKS